MLERSDAALAGIWPRAAALLGRQDLESALADLWQRKAPGLESCPEHAQLPWLAAPTPSELRGWLATVRAVMEGTAARTARSRHRASAR